MWPFAVKDDRPATVWKFETPPVPRGPISFGKEARDALVGQPGRSARQRGNLKPNPLFRSPAGPEPSGKGLAKGRPESLLEGTTAPASKGSPGEERTVGKPGSPGGEEPQGGQSPACRKDVHRDGRRLAGKTFQDGRRLAGKTSEQAETELALSKSEGMARSLLRTIPDRALQELAPAELDWEPTGVERPRPEPEAGPVATPAPFYVPAHRARFWPGSARAPSALFWASVFLVRLPSIQLESSRRRPGPMNSELSNRHCHCCLPRCALLMGPLNGCGVPRRPQPCPGDMATHSISPG